ncbi:hypothetical protein GOHSU_23_00490 [Gordonia hirsuta DSM 44140 = NBRC 16056]|uniref:DUF3298 domain-containing protein n=1 Tax=Gordonia hirsuta DSM 44140 = NBRC 16056 TaxID=1121927 RepID=L7LCD8_9ACTN|nr:hypothetical protein [Gordonia hirsuta]GAC57703.1 hypothetical protein GOHSU_23_00490 [Gordonia hirsuta DSM 44140 = NBRC 16056]
MSRRRAAPALLILAGVTSLALVGCTANDQASSWSPVSSGDGPSTVTTSRSVTTTSLSLAPSTTGFTAESTDRAGRAPNGSQWDFEVPQISGGDSAVRTAFNAAIDARADGLIEEARNGDSSTVTDGELTPDESSRAVVARTTLSGALITSGMTEGAAHPSTRVDTVVVEAGAGRQLDLDDLFTDPAAARETLVALARAADPTGRLAEASIAPDELAPWIALDDGLHLYVPVIHAMGDYVPVTLAWEDLATLLNSTAKILFVP